MNLNRSRISRSMVALGLTLTLALAACGNQTAPAPSTAATALPPPASASPTVVTVAPKPTVIAEPASAAPTMTATATQMPPTPTATPRTTVAATPAIETTPPERTQYRLAATLDYARHHLAVTQTITYVNTTGEVLAQLPLVVEANRQPGVFQLDGLRWAGGQEIAGYTLDGARLLIALPQPLPPARTVVFSVFYQLALPARAAPLGYTARQTNLGDWYPFVPPYRAGQGWLLHEPGAVGEHLVYDAADYQVDLRLAGEQTGLVIAASAPAEVDGSQHRFRIDAVRNFTLSASPEYVILYTVSGPAAVPAYVFPEHQTAGQAALEATASALALYSELFAPYPHVGLAVVEADFADGMEYDGLYFLGREYFARYDGTPQNYLTALAAHETAHQWWYGLVGNDQALEPWLDEALCTYSELLFYEALYPDLVDWWWSFRVNRFQPAGWVDSTIYEHQAFRPYVDAVYLRGAQFLQAMREQVGDEAFDALLRTYVEGLGQDIASAEDFLQLSEALGVPDRLVSRYFGRR
jgi:hypothetical protein